MTWSIIARDPDTGSLGAAVSSRFFAVGALIPWVGGGVGAVCTQALLNPAIGPRALRMMREGVPPKVALDALAGAETAREHRQIHLIAADGSSASFTGEACDEHAGHRVAADVSVAGNMLAGPEVLDATLETYIGNVGKWLPERLLRALTAGERAGGDKRGKQSAAVVVHGREEYSDLDLRVDDHPDPIGELWRLYQVAHERHLGFRAGMPTRAKPEGVRDRDELEDRIDEWRSVHGTPDFSEFWTMDPWQGDGG